ncbi:MBL fold metallo-hydrolase [Brevibacillus choshinensis]|nr:MBL fold metallo-hydrolase [Brevibacillus choshinensis]
MTVVSSLESPFFTVDFIADGIYAAIAKPGTGAMANAGIIDLGDRTLVFDTTMYTPQAGQALHNTAVQLFDRPVSLVINSHFHLDHVGGNQSFPNAVMISTDQTRTLMLERTQQFLSFALAHPEYPESVKASLEQETDERRRQELSIQLGDLLAMDAALLTLVPSPATISYDGSLTLHGSKRTAVLSAMGNGHSPCDAVLYLPGEEVLFAADLLFVHSHPSVQSGNVSEWIHILDRLGQEAFHTVVPGHGPVADKQALQSLQTYLTELLAQARLLSEQQDPLEAASCTPIPDAYQTWTLDSLYERNLKHLLHQLQSNE